MIMAMVLVRASNPQARVLLEPASISYALGQCATLQQILGAELRMRQRSTSWEPTSHGPTYALL